MSFTVNGIFCYPHFFFQKKKKQKNICRMQEPLMHNVSLKSYSFNNSLCKAKQVRIIILGILNRIRKWTGEMNNLFYLKRGQDSLGCCFCLKSLGTRLRSGGKRRKRAEIGKISMNESTLSPSQTSLADLFSPTPIYFPFFHFAEPGLRLL